MDFMTERLWALISNIKSSQELGDIDAKNSSMFYLFNTSIVEIKETKENVIFVFLTQ